MKMKRVCVCVFDRTNQVADNFDGCETVAKFDARSKKRKKQFLVWTYPAESGRGAGQEGAGRRNDTSIPEPKPKKGRGQKKTNNRNRPAHARPTPTAGTRPPIGRRWEPPATNQRSRPVDVRSGGGNKNKQTKQANAKPKPKPKNKKTIGRGFEKRGRGRGAEGVVIVEEHRH